MVELNLGKSHWRVIQNIAPDFIKLYRICLKIYVFLPWYVIKGTNSILISVVEVTVAVDRCQNL
jgi:hypothetical protein